MTVTGTSTAARRPPRPAGAHGLVAHQAPTGQAVCHLLRRAAEVDVDDPRPCPAHQRAASAIQRASRPASCTAVRSTPNPSSARARAEGRARITSSLATISDTTPPAPSLSATVRKGRSVMPAMGARKTGGAPAMHPITDMCINRKQPGPLTATGGWQGRRACHGRKPNGRYDAAGLPPHCSSLCEPNTSAARGTGF